MLKNKVKLKLLYSPHLSLSPYTHLSLSPLSEYFNFLRFSVHQLPHPLQYLFSSSILYTTRLLTLNSPAPFSRLSRLSILCYTMTSHAYLSFNLSLRLRLSPSTYKEQGKCNSDNVAFSSPSCPVIRFFLSISPSFSFFGDQNRDS